MKRSLNFLTLLVGSVSLAQPSNEYTHALRQQGMEPVAYVQHQLETYDLVVFDDGLHAAYEPFIFYQELIADKTSRLDFIFLEVFSIDAQTHIDAYLEADAPDTDLLLSVFQDDFSGMGWRYQTYLDLLEAIWNRNHDPTHAAHPIRVIAVDQPIYWESLTTQEEYQLYLKSHAARDYFMYKVIHKTMDGFKSGKKGLFLTNTRHAYKNIQHADGFPYWNTGTFLHRWHPGKSFAIRLHNLMLNIESVSSHGRTSAQGMEQMKYSWVRPDKGQWDKAFLENGNVPVAIGLKDTPFGEAPYIGNHMNDVRENQTMYDAYDGLIFLGPLDDLHFSGKTNFYFTEEFKTELKRRLRVIHGEGLDDYLQRNEANSLDEFVEELSKSESIRKSPFGSGE